MVRRLACSALLLLGATFALFAAPASAQTPSPNSNYQGCQAFVSDVTVVPAQPITVSGSGANPGDPVTAVLDTTIGTGVADSHDNFSFGATIPAAAVQGMSTLTVGCGPDGGTSAITLTIGPANAGAGPSAGNGATTGNGPSAGNGAGLATPGPLARTGAGNAIPLMKLGVALVAVGGLLLAASRRRRWARQPHLVG